MPLPDDGILKPPPQNPPLQVGGAAGYGLRTYVNSPVAPAGPDVIAPHPPHARTLGLLVVQSLSTSLRVPHMLSLFFELRLSRVPSFFYREFSMACLQ